MPLLLAVRQFAFCPLLLYPGDTLPFAGRVAGTPGGVFGTGGGELTAGGGLPTTGGGGIGAGWDGAVLGWAIAVTDKADTISEVIKIFFITFSFNILPEPGNAELALKLVGKAFVKHLFGVVFCFAMPLKALYQLVLFGFVGSKVHLW
jgi:hypothetical protein